MVAQTGKKEAVETCYRFDGLALKFKELVRSDNMNGRESQQIKQVLSALQSFKDDTLFEVSPVLLLTPCGTVSISERCPYNSFQALLDGRPDIEFCRDLKAVIPKELSLLGMPSDELAMFKLVHDATDSQICRVLPNNHVFSLKQFLVVLPYLIDNQFDVQRCGDDANKFESNLFYIEMLNTYGIVLNVFYDFKSKGWLVVGQRLDDEKRKGDRIQVLSACTS